MTQGSDAGIDVSQAGLQPAPYTSQFVEAGGLRLHYLDYGTAGCPQVELAEVPDSDHHVTLDSTAGFVHAVNAFLAKHLR